MLSGLRCREESITKILPIHSDSPRRFFFSVTQKTISSFVSNVELNCCEWSGPICILLESPIKSEVRPMDSLSSPVPCFGYGDHYLVSEKRKEKFVGAKLLQSLLRISRLSKHGLVRWFSEFMNTQAFTFLHNLSCFVRTHIVFVEDFPSLLGNLTRLR